MVDNDNLKIRKTLSVPEENVGIILPPSNCTSSTYQ